VYRISKPLLKAAAVGLAATFLLSACSAAGSSGDPSASSISHASDANSVLNWAFSLPTSWDPVVSHTGNDVNQLSLTYATLTELDKKGNVAPGLAKSWKYSSDGKNVTFTLRPGLTFSDGTPLNSDAVKDFFTRALSQPGSFILPQIGDVSGVTVDSATKFTINLTQADYQIPYLVAGRTGMITSPTAAKKNVAGLNTTPVGAGPFVMTDFVAESHADFVKNPNYWDAKDIHIGKVALTVAPDPSTLVAAVQSGTVNVATLPASDIAQAKAAGLNVTVAPSLAVSDISINRNKAPLNNPAVVQALRYTFDRSQFVKVLTNGAGSTSAQPFPKGYIAYSPAVDKLWGYNPSKAKSILKAAGIAPGSISIEITVMSTGTQAGELVQSQLKNVGINSTIKVIPLGSTTWQNDVYIGKNAEIAIDGTVGRESPVQNLLATYGTAGIMNLSAAASGPFLAALAKVQQTPITDPSYQAVLQNAVKLGVEQSPTDYIYSTPWIIVSAKSVKDLNIIPSQLRWEGTTIQAQ
jgi:peptide/nickel transport system substrate-binding protein